MGWCDDITELNFTIERFLRTKNHNDAFFCLNNWTIHTITVAQSSHTTIFKWCYNILYTRCFNGNYFILTFIWLVDNKLLIKKYRPSIGHYICHEGPPNYNNNALNYDRFTIEKIRRMAGWCESIYSNINEM